MTEIAIFGLGEAGALFARDLVAENISVRAFDPADVATPAGVRREDNPQAAVESADIILALTAGADAPQALAQAIDVLPKNALYADLATSSAAMKQQLAATAQQAGLDFADVALMTIVPGKGLYTPSIVSGSGAQRFTEFFSALGMPTQKVDGEAGAAATRKLLRSVMMKGLAAVLIESLQAGAAAGCEDWLWENLVGELSRADEALVARLLRGTQLHAVRRIHEMECTEELLEGLGVDATMTRATTASLRRVLKFGIPSIPDAPG